MRLRSDRRTTATFLRMLAPRMMAAIQSAMGIGPQRHCDFSTSSLGAKLGEEGGGLGGGSAPTTGGGAWGPSRRGNGPPLSP